MQSRSDPSTKLLEHSILRLVEPFGRFAAQSCSANGPATTSL
jgi:hypothetical protein